MPASLSAGRCGEGKCEEDSRHPTFREIVRGKKSFTLKSYKSRNPDGIRSEIASQLLTPSGCPAHSMPSDTTSPSKFVFVDGLDVKTIRSHASCEARRRKRIQLVRARRAASPTRLLGWQREPTSLPIAPLATQRRLQWSDDGKGWTSIYRRLLRDTTRCDPTCNLRLVSCLENTYVLSQWLKNRSISASSESWSLLFQPSQYASPSPKYLFQLFALLLQYLHKLLPLLFRLLPLRSRVL